MLLVYSLYSCKDTEDNRLSLTCCIAEMLGEEKLGANSSSDIRLLKDP